VAADEVDAWAAKWRTNDFAAAAEAATELHAQIEANREAYVAVTGEEDWRLARTNAANLRDGYLFATHYMRGDFGTGNATYREPGMVRNMEELAAGLDADERLLMLGHNLHCAKRLPAAGARTVIESPAVGTHLARSETWGPQYLMLAQVYERGQHRVLGSTGIATRDFDSSSTSLAGSLEALADAPALLVGTETAALPLDGLMDLQPFGTSSYPMVPDRQFDALLWVREVGATEAR
jgi:erythromycin esterase-like protein